MGYAAAVFLCRRSVARRYDAYSRPRKGAVLRKLGAGLALSSLALVLGTGLGVGAWASMKQSAARLESAERMHARSLEEPPASRPDYGAGRSTVRASVPAPAAVTTAPAGSDRARMTGAGET